MRFSRCAPFVFLVVLLSQLLVAQQSSLSLNSPSPAPVTGVTANVVGNTGNASYTYFVVATYPIGNAAPSSGAFVGQAPGTLSSTNSVRVSWQAVTGATSYTLLRTTTPNLPAACAACKLTTMAGTTYNDIGSSLTSYTLTTAPGASSQITLNNQSGIAPYLDYVLSNPAPVTGVNKIPVLNGAVTVGNCVQIGTLPGQIVDAGAACGGGGGSTAFSAITSGTNTTAAMVVGSGATLNPTGTGVINADQVNGAVVPVSQTVVGTNASRQVVAATVQGTGSLVQLSTGSTTTGHCVQFDATGNTVDAGAACGTSSGGITALTGDGTATGPGSAALTVTRLNGTSLAGLASGLLFNTTGTGVPSIATAAQILTTLGIVPVTNGGTGLGTLTSNLLYKGNGTGNFAPSSFSDNGTTASTTEPFAAPSVSLGSAPPASSVCTSTSSFLCMGEGVAPTGTLTGVDVLYPDSTAHRFKMNNNNGGAVQVVASGADINTSDQVVSTHLATPLPNAQGGTGTASTLTGLVRGGSAFTASEISGDGTTSGSNVLTVQRLNGAVIPTSAAVLSSNASNQLVASAVQGNGLKAQLSTGSTTTNDCVKFDVNGNTVDAGAACGSGGSGGGGTSGWSGITLSLLTTATQFTPPVGGALPSATETVVSLPANAAATLSHLSVTLSASLGTGTTLAVTLEDGTATPSTLTCTTASGGTSCVDNTHSVSVALGDLLSFKVVATGTVTGATPELVIGYAVGTSGVGVTNGAPLVSTNIVTGVGGSAVQTSPAAVDQTTGTISTPGGISAGTAATTTGYVSLSGLTSGSSGFSVPNVAGTAILYLLPATAGTSGQSLTDTGSGTCPTLPAGAPSTCHQLAWTTVGGSGALTQLGQIVIGTTTSPAVFGTMTCTFTAASISCASIPQTYTTLMIKSTARSAAAVSTDDIKMQYNGDTGTNYAFLFMEGAVTSATAGTTNPTATASIGNIPGSSTTANYAYSGSLEIPGYAGTTFFKHAFSSGSLGLTGSPFPAYINFSHYWTSTVAVSTVRLFLASAGNFVNGSTFTIYGVQ